ncbi:NAD(P)-dependent oxidoreductase [Metasolibacillus meyeri]|uniref:NAD(P)-dependent oxidoreductase n=1 Tax=Metasolibacillus meyeri TaxID=1071052 RepID=UPI000D2F4E68
MLLNIENEKVVVVGGGKVASQKVRALLPTQAHICMISPILTAELVTYVEEKCVIWQEKNNRRLRKALCFKGRNI